MKIYGHPSAGRQLGVFWRVYRDKKLLNQSLVASNEYITKYYLHIDRTSVQGFFPCRYSWQSRSYMNTIARYGCITTYGQKWRIIQFLHQNRIIPFRRSFRWHLEVYNTNKRLSRKEYAVHQYGLWRQEIWPHHSHQNNFMIKDNYDLLKELSEFESSDDQKHIYLERISRLNYYTHDDLIRLLLSF